MKEAGYSLEPYLHTSKDKLAYRRYLWTVAMAMLLMLGVSGSVSADADDYPDSAAINAMVMEIAESEFACIEHSWSSFEGRPITAVEIPCLNERKEEAMNASVELYAVEDGDEPANAEIVIETCRTITEALERRDPVWEQALYRDGLVLYCVPLVNPDAFDIRRKNLNRNYGSNCPEMPLNGRGFGVCLGRNQGPTEGISDKCSAVAPGPYPWSEMETAGLKELMDDFPGDYHRVINMHSDGNKVLLPPYPLIYSMELGNLCRGMARRADYECDRIDGQAKGSLWYSLGDQEEMIVVETGHEKRPPYSEIRDVLYPRIEGALLYAIRTADDPESVNGPFPISDTIQDNIVLTGDVTGAVLFDDHVHTVRPFIGGVDLPTIVVAGIRPEVTINQRDIAPFLDPFDNKLLAIQGCRIDWRTDEEVCGDKIGAAWVRLEAPSTATATSEPTPTIEPTGTPIPEEIHIANLPFVCR